MTSRFFSNVVRPTIADKRDLRRFVISVTALAWAGVMAVEVSTQLLFFTSWVAAWRDWALSTFEVLAIAIPISRWVGHAQLELHRSKAEAERQSLTDPLTGLANRRAFYEAASKLHGGALALVIADIDGFKRFNDRYGHAAGDEVIRSVGARMQEELRDLGAVARLGGEEFALVCADPSACELYTRLQDFRRRIAEEPIPVDGEVLRATVSIGFSTRREAHFDALYAAADKALYAAKSSGRDRVVDFDRLPVAPAVVAAPLSRTG